jgi:asparagine synthetase B (glutamine-hydrolysing)
MREARKAGVTTLLTGIGGDQLFDETRVECAQALRELDLMQAAQIVGLDRHPWSRSPYRLLWQRGIKPLVPEPLRRLTRPMRHRRPSANEPLLTPRAVANAVACVHERMRREAAQPFPSLVTRRLCEELVRFTTSVSLAQSEQLGARVGLVVSHPFFDLRLVELMLGMPYHVRLRRGMLKAKPLLRRAMRQHLPPMVLARRDAAHFTPVMTAALFGPHRPFA